MNRTKETIDVFDKAAESYKEKFSALDLYDDTYDLLLSYLKTGNTKVLELGCGPGNITHYLLSKRSDLDILATDLAPNMLKVAKDFNPSAKFQLLDCRNVKQLGGNYDAIIIGFCMPYLSEEECATLVKDCSQKLNKNGTLYFSAIEGDYSKSGYEYSSDGENKCFVYYHPENRLQDSINKSGLTTVKVFRKPYQRGNEIQTHIIFICQRN